MIVYSLLLTAASLKWDVVDNVLGIPGVIRADAVFGPFDVIVKIEGDDLSSIYNSTTKIIGNEVKGVERTATYIEILDQNQREICRDTVDAYAFIEAQPKLKPKLLEILLKEEGICDAYMLFGNYDLIYEIKGDLIEITSLSDKIDLLAQKYGGFKGTTTMIVKKTD